ncbi:MAG: hypothetical protein GY758_03385 [Fuerstiella sp.]|nr:hypothetical protein [Fuerstiella sp.]
MKRLMCTPPRRQRRAGTLFHYYISYLFLTSVLLTTTGLCLHTVLKADRLDDQASRSLKTLLRMEGDFRADGQDAVDVVSTATELTFHLPKAGDVVRWAVRDNVLTREKRSESRLISSDRFVFRKGTSLGFTAENETAIRLRVTDPPRLGQSDTKDAAVAEHSLFVEILVVVRSVVVPNTPPPAAAGDESGNAATSESEGAN